MEPRQRRPRLLERQTVGPWRPGNGAGGPLSNIEGRLITERHRSQIRKVINRNAVVRTDRSAISGERPRDGRRWCSVAGPAMFTSAGERSTKAVKFEGYPNDYLLERTPTMYGRGKRPLGRAEWLPARIREESRLVSIEKMTSEQR